ncbi:transmembrane amino acid transporter protein-domain-containing protein [Halteromyces radiatus]|uniref:transmembrane amino acid transporter protein-domain-containing protein n=1 Tax=Halteromyces radiatus TaxID=101107 RepID=UPI002220E77E|nr:transmembrane amino acid transporter protein-domain-containing protein [Halteromyces radiatus]KAI8093104.1 transmembrane amino acid transporter protein-domain-containing protein [Halteromyces radiatus]
MDDYIIKTSELQDLLETSSLSSSFFIEGTITNSSTCCATSTQEQENPINNIKNVESLQSILPGYGTSSIGASVMNLTNAMMGSGIIGLPLALHLCGFWFGLVCSIFVAIITCLAMHLTVQCGIQTNRYSLSGLCSQLLGTTGEKLCNFIIFFHTATTTVSYYIMLGDTLPALFHHYLPQLIWLSNRQLVVVAFGLCISLPLSLSRSPAKIAKWSTLSVMLLPLMLLGIIFRVPVYAPPMKDIVLEVVSPSFSMFKGIAIMALSFGCSQNIFGIYLSTKDQRSSTWLHISGFGTAISYLLNFTFAIMGYICFGKDVQANVLLNFPDDDLAINVVRLILGLFMVLTIPLAIHPCRDAVQTLLNRNADGRIPSDNEHILITCLIFSPILYFGATLTSLGSVFDIIGGFSTMVLGFLLPGVVFMPLFITSRDKERNPLLFNNTLKMLTWHQFILSITLVLVSLPIIYITLIDHL